MSVELVRPTAEGPRFDLRFERGRVHLSLGRPLGIDGVTIEHLVIALDFRGPVDLRGEGDHGLGRASVGRTRCVLQPDDNIVPDGSVT